MSNGERHTLACCKSWLKLYREGNEDIIELIDQRLGWKEHKGSKRPVDPETDVFVRFMDSTETDTPRSAKTYLWDHITAYQVAE